MTHLTFTYCIYLFIVNNGNNRVMWDICSKSKINTAQRRSHSFLSSVFIINFEQISHIVLVSLLLTLNIQSISNSKSQDENISWYDWIKFIQYFNEQPDLNLLLNTSRASNINGFKEKENLYSSKKQTNKQTKKQRKTFCSYCCQSYDKKWFHP